MSTGEPNEFNSHVIERRDESRRIRDIARLDLGLGVVAGIVLLIVMPGLAVTALVATPILIFCLLSFYLNRRSR